ncbi:M48 family metallopeptidase [Ideonella sp. DXS29W]|uniref:M48 family metallopeptidase n=1 Tax=Ideonella lacteola TaxID=2984193 RepID=A0ABU9BQ02_9BURK
MDAERFAQMVGRLERESTEHPRSYALKVAALAVLGFFILAIVLGAAGLGLLLLVGIALATLLTGGKALLLLFKLGKLLVLLAIPLWYLVKNSLKAMFVRLPPPQGLELTRAQAPALFAAVDHMRQRLKGPKVHHVLLVDEVNAAVVQRPLFGLIGFPRNYLLLGLPLLDSMSPDEAMAVVAHEYGHLAGSHSRFGAFIYRLRLSWGTIQHHAEQWQGFAGKGLNKLIGWYAPYFNAYTFVLARANEYQADRASVDLVGAQAAADALKRVNVAAPRYDRFLNQTLEQIRDVPQPPRNLAERWAHEASGEPAPEQVQRWLGQALARETNLADTHPALAARLAALPGQSTAMDQPPRPRQGPSAAQAWLGAQLPALHQHFQAAWADRVTEPWRQRHEEVQNQRGRLSALRALPERSGSEEFEMLRLQSHLEPDTDWRDTLAAFNASHPDHPGGLYLEGVLRLEKDDESGLPLLERAMALDADAIKPACERAFSFWQQRGDKTRAEAYGDRWRQRDAFEHQRQAEIARLNTQHPVRPHGLDPQVLAQVRQVLDGVNRDGIAAAYLVRRELPSDPSVDTYVLGVELTWWAKRRSRQANIVNRLAHQEWPLHLMICTLDGDLSSYGKTLKRIDGAQLL